MTADELRMSHILDFCRQMSALGTKTYISVGVWTSDEIRVANESMEREGLDFKVIPAASAKFSITDKETS